MKKKESKFNFNKIKEMLKDKKGRAKIELSAYLIFFLLIVVFARISSSSINGTSINNDNNIASFINDIKDNYEYNMDINIDNDIYSYHTKVLGNNASIKRNGNNIDKYFYIMNNKYYELDENGNYILTTSNEVYPYISYNYLNIDNIKNFIKNSIKEDNIYKIKVSDIILNNNSNEIVSITIDEDNKSIDIDYTNLLKVDNNIDNANVKIVFNNINNIMSLEE